MKRGRAAHGTCSECGRDRLAAGPLAHGDHVALCGDCAASAMLEIAAADASQVLWQVVSGWLARLPDTTEEVDAIRMVDAAAALCRDDPEPTRWVANEAARLSLPGRALELIDGLGADLTDSDRISLAYYAFLAGDSRRGLAALAPVDGAALEYPERLYYLLNRAALTLDGDDSARATTAGAADMAEFRRLLERDAHRMPRDELDMLLAAEQIGLGRLDLAAQRWTAAVDRLRQVTDKYGDRRTFVLVLLGDALAGAGDRDAAESAWRRALASGPPTAFHVRQAASRLAGPYR
jgi:hypothetical protein